MRRFIGGVAAVVGGLLAAGCTGTTGDSPIYGSRATEEMVPLRQTTSPRLVRVEGTDGTILYGHLLNGSVTIDCGQGMLTLLTDYIYTIDLGSDAATVDSPSARLSGAIQEKQFLLKSEHGVFTLEKARLRRITFEENLAPTVTTQPSRPQVRVDANDDASRVGLRSYQVAR